MKKELIITIAIVTVVTLLPAVLSAQPLPGGGPGGGVAGAPIDPASWLIPAGLIAYQKYKQRKQGKDTPVTQD